MDISKDLFYAIKFEHNSLTVTILLWIFSLFLVVYTTITILLMNQKQFYDEYERIDDDDNDKDNGEDSFRFRKEESSLAMAKKKVLRIFKEILCIHNEKELENVNTKRRAIRHAFFTALFENLPQFVLQLYESFDQGYTFGFFKTFSISLSIVMF